MSRSTSNLYASSQNAMKFSLSLSNVKTSGSQYTGYIDVEKLYGVDSSYVANIWDGIPLSNTWWGKGDNLMTVFSLNQGGQWARLHAPTR